MYKIKQDRLYDVLSVSIIFLIAILSFIRFNYLPQFIDGYYHLSCANAFIKSGGWVGIDWWNFAPYGRPNLYPPFYHFLLSLIISLGTEGINSLRIVEVTIVPLFFFTLWYIFRKDISSAFSFLFLVVASSFFSFYSSVSCNVPASFAIIFGVLSWHYLKKDKIISSILFLALAFYTHAGIPWVFEISMLILAIFNREDRKKSIIVVLASFILAFPFLVHELKYINYVNITILREIKFSHYSIPILSLGLIAILYLFNKEKFFVLLFLGYTIGAVIIFFKYPYRLFSAQGMLGVSLSVSYLLYEAQKGINSTKGWIAFSFILFCLFFIHPTFDLDNGKLKANTINSTYYNIASGKFISLFEFNSLLYPRYYFPLADIIKKYTGKQDIITSNLKPAAQIFSALTDRATSYSIMSEVRGFKKVSRYATAKLVIWMKPDYKELSRLINRFHLIMIYANDTTIIFINPYCRVKAVPLRAEVTFKVACFWGIFLLFIFIADNVKIFKRKKSIFRYKQSGGKDGKR